MGNIRLVKYLSFPMSLWLALFYFVPASIAQETAVDSTQEINQLNQQIQQKQKDVTELKRQSDVYQKNIDNKQSEILNLMSQLSIFENQVAKTNIDIKTQQALIDQTGLEIAQVQLQIQDKEKKMEAQKSYIASLLRQLNKEDDRSYLEVLVLNNSFSDFFDQLKYLEQVQGDLQRALDGVINDRQQLVAYNQELDNKNKNLTDMKVKMEGYRGKLELERSAKETLLAQTQDSESRFHNLLAQVRLEKSQVDQEIQSLEDSIKQRLERNREQNPNLQAPSELIWPIPFQGIATYFHDPDYVFRRLVGEHSGVDLRTLINGAPSAGVPVRAAASGTVIKVIDNGRFTGNAIYVAHGGGLMTVYYHLSRVDVKEDDFLAVGKVLGLSGGLPGAYGAGLSSGPHLHFEVRLDGIPVNPLDYLPPPPVFVANR